MIEMIINKTETCNCGCGGNDPWHRLTYRRVVTKSSETEGTVRMPYSSKPVRVTRKKYRNGEFGMWRVDRESIVFDRS